MFNKKTIRDVEFKGRRVLLRADYNVPIEAGQVRDDYRLRASLPTIKFILEQKPSALIIISHLGRPDGKRDPAYSLKPVAAQLAKLLGEPVQFAGDCVGEEAVAAAKVLLPGEILMLENLRFHTGEEKNSAEFAQQLATDTGAKLFVQDGFGVVHRAHASTDAITKILPSVVGLLLEKEVSAITKLLDSPDRPFTAVVGGAKISDKIDVLNRFIEIADCVAVVGALANDFLAAQKVPVGKSLVDKSALAIAQEVLELAKKAEARRDFNFLVPLDAVVATSSSGRGATRVVDFAANNLADIEAYPKQPNRSAYTIADDEMILDIGPLSSNRIAGAIKVSKTVVWSGPAGMTEVKGIAGAHDPFAHGTHTLVDAMISDSRSHKNRPYSLIGGGDTVAYVEVSGLIDEFNHVSTGGSASLELMAGHPLPGVDALEDKQPHDVQ